MSITQVGYIALWILAFVLPIQLIIGALVARKSGESSSHYFIGGKQFPLILIFFLDFATVMGVGNFIGYAGKGYSIGFGQFYMLLGEQGTKIVFALLIAGIAGRYAYTTLNQFIYEELYHDKWIRALGAILMSLAMVCGVGAQAIGIGALLSVVLGVNPTTGIWIAILVAIGYTYLGGMFAIAWTDLVQGIIRIIVGFLFFFVIYKGVNGIGGLHEAVAASTKPQLWSMGSVSPLAGLALFLAPLAGVITTQAWWQRCFSAKDAETAKKGFLYSAIFAIVMCTCSILVGMATYTLNPNLARPDLAMPWLLQNWLNPVVAALLVVTIIGADMTVSAGFLNAAVSMITIDLIKPFFRQQANEKELVKYARGLTLLLGIGAVIVAFTFPSVLSAVLFAYAAVGGGFAVPLVLGIFWKDKNGKTCVTRNAALASVICGGLSVLIIESIPKFKAAVGGGINIAILLALVLTIGITLMERSSKKAEITG